MKKIRIGLEWFLNPDHLPFVVAMEKGFAKKLNWELELVEPKDHYEAYPKLEKGELDLAITEPIHLVLENQTKMGLLGFARFLHTDGGVMYLENSGIERPRDLINKTITYPGAPSPLGKAIVASMIENDGGGKEAPFKTYDGGFYHTKTLMEKKADAATLIFYNFEIIEARLMGLEANFFSLKEWGIPDFCQLHLIALAKNVQENKEFYSQFAKLMQQAISFIKQNPAEALAIWEGILGRKLSPLEEKIYQATWPCFTYDMNLCLQYWQNLWSWCHDHKLVEGILQLDNLWYFV